VLGCASWPDVDALPSTANTRAFCDSTLYRQALEDVDRYEVVAGGAANNNSGGWYTNAPEEEVRWRFRAMWDECFAGGRARHPLTYRSVFRLVGLMYEGAVQWQSRAVDLRCAQQAAAHAR
jgi:hypothetical protein